MVIRIILFVCGLIFIISTAQGQGKKQDVIYLKNGSVIRGAIKERIAGQKVSIETLDGSLWVFTNAEVDSIRREPMKMPLLDQSYHPVVTIGISSSLSDEVNSFGIESSLRARPFSFLSFDIGVAAWRLLSSNIARMAIPIFFGSSVYFSNDPQAVSMSGQALFGLLTNDRNSDFLIGARTALHIPTGGPMLTIGYDLTNSRYAEGQARLGLSYVFW